jgi:hypothetical protein
LDIFDDLPRRAFVPLPVQMFGRVSTDTVARFERGDELKERTIDALQRALEATGIEFTNGDQPGVRLTKAAAARPAEPGSAQSRRVAAKVVRRKTAKANEKKR